MSNQDVLRMLGSPDVRNAVLLNEIGVLLHSLGKLSKEFIAGEATFPYHLILRRLSRGQDPYLGHDATPFSAIRYALVKIDLSAEEKGIAHLLSREMADLGAAVFSPAHNIQSGLESVLTSVREKLAPAHEGAFDRVAGLVKDISINVAWQRETEEAIATMRPAFISVQGFYDGLDRLPFVADLVEMKGRTWHPEVLLPPEVRLLRALSEGEELIARPEASVDVERLGQVRQICCEVLANQLLEIYNIRKDGPGDLGSWFWKERLYPRSEKAMALLHHFDKGIPLYGEGLEAVRWLGVRPITEWAYRKVVVGRRRNGKKKSLWEESYELASLHKSAVVQALIEGSWTQPNRHTWRTLRVTLAHPAADALDKTKELIEVEYPLGNELSRDKRSIHFTCPGLGNEPAAVLREMLRDEIVLALNTELPPEVFLTPIVEESSEVFGTS